jgi:hypothetical protein
MATRKPTIIDGEFTEVPTKATLGQILGPEVDCVLTDHGIIDRDQFRNQLVPERFERQIGRVNKGGSAQE